MLHHARDDKLNGELLYDRTIFPVLCQLLARLVASAHNPKVAAAMLYKTKRLLLNFERHPDIITFFCELLGAV